MSLRNLVPSFGKKRIPVRYDNDPVSMFQEDMSRLVDNFFRGFDVEPFGSRLTSFSPDIEVSESEKEYKVEAELPGMDEKDIDISLTDNVLTISGEKKEEKESKSKGYFMKERSYGSFERSIPLYSEVNINKVGANFNKGILTVTLPKSAKEIERRKKIKVTTG